MSFFKFSIKLFFFPDKKCQVIFVDLLLFVIVVFPDKTALFAIFTDEIHLRITSPPVQYSCYYGIDTPHRSNLIASGNDVEYIREYIGCDSLKFLDIDLMIEATENKATFCKACFDGDYPVKKLDREELLSC